MSVVPPIAAAGATLLLTAGCSAPPTLSSGDVQQAIQAGLVDQVGGAFTVTCPSAVPAEAGQRFTCSVTDQGTQETVVVQVAVTDADGGFTWQVVPTPSVSPSASATPSPSGSAVAG